MRKYSFIVIGGALGAILRFMLKNSHILNYYEQIPFATLFINIMGSFLMGLILTITFKAGNYNFDLKLGITTGFLGAYTTFSTFCRETAALIVVGEYLRAISYVTLSIVLGLMAVYVGIILARKICYRNY